MDTALNGGRPSEARWRRLLAIIGIASSLAAVAAELSGYLHFLSTVNDWVTAILNGISSAMVGRPLSPPELWLLKTATALSAIWLTCFVALQSYVARYERTSFIRWIGGLYFLDPPDQVRWATTKTATILFIALPVWSAYRTVCPPWYMGKFVSCRGLHIKLWLYLWEVAFVTTMLATSGIILYFISKAASTVP
jgi:hypothetical protein